MTTDIEKKESLETAQEQFRNENNQNEMILPCEEDDQEDLFVYSPIHIHDNEEADTADGDDADVCLQKNAFTEVPDARRSIHEGEASTSLIKIPATLVVPSTSDSAVTIWQPNHSLETGHGPSSCYPSLTDTNSSLAHSFGIDYHCNSNEDKRKASKLPEKVTSMEIEHNAINVYIDHPYALQEISHSSHQSLVPEGALKCDECKRFFKSGRFLQRHLQYCGKEPTFSCTICNYRAARKQTLQQHLLCVHKINPSQLADYGVGPKQRVPKRPESQFKCGKCQRTYKNIDTLRVHLRRDCAVLGRSFLCTKCDYRAKQKCHLRDHLAEIHMVHPSQFAVHGVGYSFQCDVCPFRGKNEAALKKHKATEHQDPGFATPSQQINYSTNTGSSSKVSPSKERGTIRSNSERQSGDPGKPCSDYRSHWKLTAKEPTTQVHKVVSSQISAFGKAAFLCH